MRMPDRAVFLGIREHANEPGGGPSHPINGALQGFIVSIYLGGTALRIPGVRVIEFEFAGFPHCIRRPVNVARYFETRALVPS
jgi:hypothetical protein